MIGLELWRASIGSFVSSKSCSSIPARRKVVLAREMHLFSGHDQQHDPSADCGASCYPPPPRTELVVTSSPLLLLLQVSRQLLLAAPSDLSHCSGRKPVRMEDILTQWIEGKFKSRSENDLKAVSQQHHPLHDDHSSEWHSSYHQLPQTCSSGRCTRCRGTDNKPIVVHCRSAAITTNTWWSCVSLQWHCQ